MIKSAAITRAQDGEPILQILLNSDGVEFKHLTREELFKFASDALAMLAEGEGK